MTDTTSAQSSQQPSAQPSSQPASRASRPHTLSIHLLTTAIAFVAALGVWSAMLPWGELTTASGHAGPVLACVLLVALTSSLARPTGLGAWLAFPAGLVTGIAVPLWLADAPVVPTPNGVRLLAEALAADVDAVTTFAVPVAEEGGNLAVLFTLIALGAVLLTDLAVTGPGRVTVAGLVLLVLHLVPSNIGPEASWTHFTLTAACFVLLLLLVRARENLRWDALTRTDRTWATDDAHRPGSPRLVTAGLPAAVTVGTLAIAVAGLAAAHLPLPESRNDGGGPGGGGGDEVTVANPLVDLRRDLARGEDVDLLVVTSGGETPSYVRTSVLTQYDGKQWSTGEREASRSQGADGSDLPPVPGVSSWSTTPVEFMATSAFRSRWLPLPEQVSSVSADGDWRYDVLTRDFVAWEQDLDTAGTTWSAMQVEPEVEAAGLDSVRAGGPPGGRVWTELPDDLPALVSDLAEEVTAEADTPFRKARALQSWFRSEFDYSLEQVESVGDDDLVAFLSPEGRVGYCEQFAASMALMARSLGIPARVAVGFLTPEAVGDGQYVFSSHDLHAWPELYFEGAGWLRFEPTPGARSPEPPGWSTDPLPGESSESPRPSASATPSAQPSSSPSVTPRPRPDTDVARTRGDQADGFVSARTLGITFGVLVLLGLFLAPSVLRRRRRAARVASTSPELWWSEVRDTVLDLGGTWPTGRSPRESAATVREDLPEIDEDALNRLVAAVETSRYAPPGHGATGAGANVGAGVVVGAGAADVDAVRVSLTRVRSRTERLRADLLPRSLVHRG